MLAVHNYQHGHAMLAGLLHSVLHQSKRTGGARPKLTVGAEAPSCNDCKMKASAVLSAMVEPTELAWASERFPQQRVLPAGWRRRSPLTSRTEVWDNDGAGLRVIYSESKQDDDRWWAHVSLSRRDREVPTWEQVREVKQLFVGDAEAYIVLPPPERYVNQHEGVLHLFACRDAPTGVLPDFTQGTGSL